ncbi:unnamed protein product [Rotaria sordida]|uniref:Uncharacterized protein n=1 Tax=Rotaria sordida TaxID=392033 RepID=A0A814UTL1_9BILA|nr:unnamed protein product [Rotaria sordida]CAF1103954.1 unnamed protein product [Rotaria sordida]CAF1178691.1 unnamed protein product [Rotaria sordida]CAF1438252.1 unnamed protein product [Rotaria sordida]
MMLTKRTMMLLRANEHKQMVWKNGGGITSEIARVPNNEHEDFDWRLSIAQVKPPGGPFSIFPGIDRTLCVMSQHELYLMLNNNSDDMIYLNQDSLPYSFPGELSITCQLHSETLTDFNVMTRRTKFRHDVERVKMTAKQEKTINVLDNTNEIVFIVVGQGQVVTNNGIQMIKHDALRIDQHPLNIQISAATDDTQLYIVRLKPIFSQENDSINDI